MTPDQMHHEHPLISEFHSIIVQLVTKMYDDGMPIDKISKQLRVDFDFVTEILEYYRGKQEHIQPYKPIIKRKTKQ